MKMLIAFLSCVCCLWISASKAQDWTTEYLKANIDSGPNTVVAYFRTQLEEAVGSKAPELTFRLLGQDTSLVRLRDYEGKTVLVNFWKPGCSGCRKQHPTLGKLQGDYADKGLVVLYVSPYGAAAQQKYYADREIQGPKGVLADWKSLQKPYQIFAVPSAIVVDVGGIIRNVWIGTEEYDALEQRILPYLGAAE